MSKVGGLRRLGSSFASGLVELLVPVLCDCVDVDMLVIEGEYDLLPTVLGRMDSGETSGWSSIFGCR